jgi:hypothetical protein
MTCPRRRRRPVCAHGGGPACRRRLIRLARLSHIGSDFPWPFTLGLIWSGLLGSGWPDCPGSGWPPTPLSQPATLPPMARAHGQILFGDDWPLAHVPLTFGRRKSCASGTTRPHRPAHRRRSPALRRRPLRARAGRRRRGPTAYGSLVARTRTRGLGRCPSPGSLRPYCKTHGWGQQ